MRTVAVTMVKDEADIIPYTLAQMLAEVDHVIVADNGSTDDTRGLVADIAAASGRVTVVDDHEPGYHQSRKMTALALRARLEHGAEWVVPFDADEFWYSPFGRIGDILGAIDGAQWLTVRAALYDHVTTDIDPPDEDPIARIRWRKTQPNPLPKVAVRWREDLVIEMGNHGAYYEGGATLHPTSLVVRHYPYRSEEQFLRKVRNGAAAYAAAGDDVPADAGAHWRQWGDILRAHGPEAVVDIYRSWHHRANPHDRAAPNGELLPALIDDPAPR